MLQAAFIREHKEKVLNGLDLRNFKNAETLINKVLDLDETRRATQAELRYCVG